MSLRADVARLTAEVQHERSAAAAAQGRLALASQHAADMRSLCLVLASGMALSGVVGAMLGRLSRAM